MSGIIVIADAYGRVGGILIIASDLYPIKLCPVITACVDASTLTNQIPHFHPSGILHTHLKPRRKA